MASAKKTITGRYLDVLNLCTTLISVSTNKKLPYCWLNATEFYEKITYHSRKQTN